ncbi:hypothetical protein [Reyranella soli]|uniref:Uncharacterized protein n=1 Tax=Reyranella soli TaxID=1230389 RepID=A0A512NSK7_9HYPH|nr:hypothetical protein [Reyranella soli]GEP61925.1 hypothetical protein RSO01_90910 [Reyranella soli]
MNEKETNALLETLEAAILWSLQNGQHPTKFTVEHIPGGLTEINGIFKLELVALACLAAIERSNYKLTR